MQKEMLAQMQNLSEKEKQQVYDIMKKESSQNSSSKVNKGEGK